MPSRLETSGGVLFRHIIGLGSNMERRKWPRLELKLNVQFSLPAEGAEAAGDGTSQNISADGVYFLTPDWQRLAVGKTLALRLSGFAPINQGPLFRTVGGKATILRLDVPKPEDSAARAGVAARFRERPKVELYSFSA